MQLCDHDYPCSVLAAADAIALEVLDNNHTLQIYLLTYLLTTAW